MKTRHLSHGAIIAALYTALTIITMPISYGVMQIRIAEALTVLPALTPAAIPGLFVGCFISNMLGPNGIIDIVFGSIATLIAGVATYRLRKKIFLAPLPPVLANGIIIGSMLHYVYKVPVSLLACILWVGLGELIACYGIGYPLLRYLNKRRGLVR
ncbi:MAG TPA: QueT transporter family protein [Anaerovoracaceae bacterium]|nr:QueT transporter family protein [Anaerovoracaceae bacterium]